MMDTLTFFSHRNLRYLFYVMLATGIVYFLNTLSMYYLNLQWVDHTPTVVEEVQATPQKASARSSIEAYRAVWERNLFSVTVEEKQNRAETDMMYRIQNMALTSLNLTLVGTVIDDDGGSWAIIKENNTNREQRVSVDDTISGARVVMILRNKVVLNFNGKDELLVMGIEKIRAERQETVAAPEKEGEVSTFKISRDLITNSVNNIGQIMSQVRVKPYVKDGKPRGFHVSRIREGSLVADMGFKDNDIVTSINGQEIRTAEDIMRLYGAMKDSRFFSIGILRNDRPMTLNYKVR